MLKGKTYPFSAIVGQQQLKDALLIALVNPLAGGLLIGGAKGTAKSLAARSVAQLTDTQLVNLPLNITEDMLFGTLDLEYALKTGRKRFTPGLLGRANGQLLYIDEANLLSQELLIAVLEACNNGESTIERDGISSKQICSYTILATMNPEEGPLPNPILDRFGMYVEVSTETDLSKRITIMQRALAYEKNSESFIASYEVEQSEIKARLDKAKELLPKVQVSNAMLILAAQQCAKSLCAGHRADIYLIEAARAWAALQGRSYVLPLDIDKAAVYVLAHRMRQLPQEQKEPEEKQEPEKRDSDQPNNQPEQEEASALPERDNTDSLGDKSQENQQEQLDNSTNSLAPEEQVVEAAKNIPMPKLLLASSSKALKRGSGKRSITRTDLKQGRYVRAELPKGKLTDLAFDATIRAAAPYQKLREKTTCAVNISQEDLRQKVREKRIGNTFLFAVDASGSMGARSRMKAVKGAVLTLLQEAYQKRDRVGMLAFRRNKAELLLPITRSVDLAQKCLAELPTGGKTPLAEGLACALQTLALLNKNDQELEPILVVVTDGRANSSIKGEDPVKNALKVAAKIRRAKLTSIVIDTENDFIKLGIAHKVAEAMGANYFNLQKLMEKDIIHILRNL